VHPPSVDRLARSLADTGLPHPMLVDAARSAIAAGDPDSARDAAEQMRRALLQPVVNATGVLLHTNLGRAPMAVSVDERYRNLELDLATGSRGSRHGHAGSLLARACGAQAALVVNNGAAAVLLVLAALARDRGVVVSRGELVEIGGGFRVPEVMAESGALLVEVGTTNRTRSADFALALADPATDVALLLKVHQSNYRITGFTEQPSVSELAAVAAAAATDHASPLVPVVADIGSGLLDAACPWLPGGPPAWLADEPAARQTLDAGADVVVFSGDKLLGGPQAGIIAGRADLVAACTRHPLARALRPGGLVLAALQDLALHYLHRQGHDIAFWRLATIPVDDLRARAEAIVGSLDPAARGVEVEVVELASVPGGGTLPGVEIASAGLSLAGDHTEPLRAADPPIIARVHEARTLLDLRTVDPADDTHVASAIAALLR